jgi:hypothetical protein
MIRRRRESENDDEDSPFDADGILKDGRSARIALFMRDSMSPLQRAVMDDAYETGRDRVLRDASALGLITDAFGDTGAGLHRPGYRLQQPGERATESARMRDEAYRQVEAQEARRWQGDSDREISVRQITGDARVDAYFSREEHDTNAWRGPANK